MASIVQTLRTVLQGPEPVRWAGNLYGFDVEFRVAIEEGIPSSALETAGSMATSQDEFRQYVVEAYYENC